jgi:hypothetical protein
VGEIKAVRNVQTGFPLPGKDHIAADGILVIRDVLNIGVVTIIAARISIKDQDIDSLLLHTFSNFPKTPVILSFRETRMIFGKSHGLISLSRPEMMKN